MRRFDRFLKGNIYPLLMSIGAFIAWIMKGDLAVVNQYMVIGYLLLAAIILALFKDTSNVIPIFLSLFFMINTPNLGLKDIRTFSMMYVVFGLVMAGLVIHLLRFRHKVHVGFLSLGFLLMAISYMIPLFYIPYSNTFLAISLIGFLYLVLYLFFRNTAYGKTELIMRHFFFASLIILAQLYFNYTKGFLAIDWSKPIGEIVRHGLTTAWGSGDFGYGIINDVVIFFTLLVSGQVYLLFKYPKHLYLWIFPVLSVIAVALSGSRGGWISWGLLLVLFYVLILAKGTKTQMVIATSLAILAVVPLIIEPRIPRVLYQVFAQGGLRDWDTFTSWRVSLYSNALNIFKKFPYFGAGWTYTLDVGNSDRIQVFHSTIFHTLAISGLFGVFAVVVFIISQMVLLVKKLSIPVAIAAIGWVVTMFHGLMDNTVHMLIYTILTIFLFTAIERDDGIEEEVKKFPFIVEKESTYSYNR